VFISGAVAEFTSPLGVHAASEHEQHGVNQSPSVHHQLNPSRNPLFFADKTMSDKNIFLSYMFLSAQDEWLAVPLRFVVSSSLDPVTNWCVVERAARFVMADFLEAVDFNGEPRMNADQH
jgi:hypothetical protein